MATESAVSDTTNHHGNSVRDEEGEEEDEFAGILEDTNSSPRDEKGASLAAVNYKVSMEEYEKVDIFQTTPTEQKGISPQNKEATTPVTPHDSEETKPKEPEEPPTETPPYPSSNGITTTTSAISTQEPGQTIVTTNGQSSEAGADSDSNAMQSDNQHETTTATTPTPDDSLITEQLLKAQAEWDAVGTIQPGPGGEEKGKYGPTSGQTSSISFNETLAYFQRSDMSQYMSKIKPTVERSGWTAIKHFVLGPPKMKANLHEERNLVFAIAQCPFDDSEDIHQRVLQTIYKQLTGSTIDCPRFGSHWEQIGFQGNDPSTDLRACGFLGLMTLLHFLMDPERLTLAKEIYKLSLHETQNFPFCVMSINMTKISLQALREEHLSRECNRRKQVLGVFNDFYAGIFLNLFQIWKQQHKTIKDSGFVIKDVETNAKKNPKDVVHHLEDYLKNKSSGGAGSTSPKKNGGGGADYDFAGVHELDEEEEGD